MIGLASFYVLNGLTIHPWPPVGCFKLFYGDTLIKMSVSFVCFCEYLCPFVLSRDFAMNSLASSLEFNFNFEVAVSTNFCKFVLLSAMNCTAMLSVCMGSDNCQYFFIVYAIVV
ncbi:hypothetical protein DSO57_1012649 [Entomophthora muscae]|uniref:Uncharacterized protein n=1 Tax=Entomophthora muscae TaxID=34485 RepID=A0ACC2S7Y6_9FUNG|nr:hypothetical protein DSO57_1012649 [Entomophthora muscae]